jgi:hypothetical protein
MKPKLPEHVRRQIAVQASGADPRTVDKVYRGEPVRGAVAERVRAALEAAGLLPPRGKPALRLDSGPGLDVGTLADDGGSR